MSYAYRPMMKPTPARVANLYLLATSLTWKPDGDDLVAHLPDGRFYKLLRFSRDAMVGSGVSPKFWRGL